MDNVLHQPDRKRAAALTALFAILLIVVAPLISVSFQKDPMSAMPGMHHDMSMMSMDEHHGDMQQIGRASCRERVSSPV